MNYNNKVNRNKKRHISISNSCENFDKYNCLMGGNNNSNNKKNIKEKKNSDYIEKNFFNQNLNCNPYLNNNNLNMNYNNINNNQINLLNNNYNNPNLNNNLFNNYNNNANLNNNNLNNMNYINNQIGFINIDNTLNQNFFYPNKKKEFNNPIKIKNNNINYGNNFPKNNQMNIYQNMNNMNNIKKINKGEEQYINDYFNKNLGHRPKHGKNNLKNMINKSEIKTNDDIPEFLKTTVKGEKDYESKVKDFYENNKK